MKATKQHSFGGAGEADQKPASIVVRLIDHLEKTRDLGRTLTVLDYGCGCGRNVDPFLQSKLDFQFFASDLQPNIPGLCRRFTKNKKVQVVRLGEQPIHDILNLNRKFDAVVALASVHHASSPKEIINFLQFATLPRGIHAVLVFTVGTQPTWLHLGKPLSPESPNELTVLSPFGPNELLTYYPPEQWRVLFYEEFLKKDNTGNRVMLNGKIAEEPEHFHSIARIMAEKLR